MWLWVEENQKHTAVNKNTTSCFYLHPLIAWPTGLNGERLREITRDRGDLLVLTLCLLLSPAFLTFYALLGSWPCALPGGAPCSHEGHSHKLERAQELGLAYARWVCRPSLLTFECLYMRKRTPWWFKPLGSVRTPFNTNFYGFQHGNNWVLIHSVWRKYLLCGCICEPLTITAWSPRGPWALGWELLLYVKESVKSQRRV